MRVREHQRGGHMGTFLVLGEGEGRGGRQTRRRTAKTSLGGVFWLFVGRGAEQEDEQPKGAPEGAFWLFVRRDWVRAGGGVSCA